MTSHSKSWFLLRQHPLSFGVTSRATVLHELRPPSRLWRLHLSSWSPWWVWQEKGRLGNHVPAQKSLLPKVTPAALAQSIAQRSSRVSNFQGVWKHNLPFVWMRRRPPTNTSNVFLKLFFRNRIYVEKINLITKILSPLFFLFFLMFLFCTH